MKKNIALLFATIMCSSTVLTTSASDESMYNDIVNFTLSHNNTSQWSSPHTLDNAIEILQYRKNILLDEMLIYHTKEANLDTALAYGAISAEFIALGTFGFYRGTYYPSERLDDIALGTMNLALAGIFAGAGLYNLAKNKITIYFCKKKITEIDTTVKKLEVLRQQNQKAATTEK